MNSTGLGDWVRVDFTTESDLISEGSASRHAY